MISTVPLELAERILAPREVAAFAQTCARASSIDHQTNTSWRTLFLCFPFDDLRLSTGHSSHESGLVSQTSAARAG